jgi:hypothetical protein
LQAFFQLDRATTFLARTCQIDQYFPREKIMKFKYKEASSFIRNAFFVIKREKVQSLSLKANYASETFFLSSLEKGNMSFIKFK